MRIGHLTTVLLTLTREESWPGNLEPNGGVLRVQVTARASR